MHADKHPDDMKMCGITTRIVCRISLLNSDDYSLNGSPYSVRTCTMCDFFFLEDIKHTVMQCPVVGVIRIKMYKEIDKILQEFDDISQKNPSEVLGWLLGGESTEIESETMANIWQISGTFISEMYSLVSEGASGIE